MAIRQQAPAPRREPGEIIRGVFPEELPVIRKVSRWWHVRNARHAAKAEIAYRVALAVARLTHIPIVVGELRLRVRHADGTYTDYGRVSRKVVTDAGVAAIVDAFQNSVELETFIYHGFGTGGTAEGQTQTALVTELTTEYATNNTRPTGSATEGASANIFRTVGTLDPDSAVAITEHGIFSQAATGGGTMLDRSLFSVINVGASGDTLEATYDLTFPANG